MILYIIWEVASCRGRQFISVWRLWFQHADITTCVVSTKARIESNYLRCGKSGSSMWKASLYSYFNWTHTFSDALFGNLLSEQTLAASHLRMNNRQEPSRTYHFSAGTNSHTLRGNMWRCNRGIKSDRRCYPSPIPCFSNWDHFPCVIWLTDGYICSQSTATCEIQIRSEWGVYGRRLRHVVIACSHKRLPSNFWNLGVAITNKDKNPTCFFYGR